MKLSELFRDITIEETDVRDWSIDIAGISRDSRSVKKGELFVCLRGSADDGHAHIAQAMENGAAACVVEECIPPACGLEAVCANKACVGECGAPDMKRRCSPYIRVRSTRRAYAFLWYNLTYREYSGAMKLAAVTGTNGKTTTTHMLCSILRTAGFKTALIGTVTDGMTTPDPDILYPQLAQYAREGYECAVMEASSHALALEKLSPLRFKVAAFTNLTRDHLDFHKTYENYLAAKAKLFSLCDIGIVNIDDAASSDLMRSPDVRCPMLTLSAMERADYTVSDVVSSMSDGIAFRFTCRGYAFASRGHSIAVHSAMPGVFNVCNAACALACADVFGVSAKACADGLAALTGVAGRMERVDVPRGDIIVYIDYAHTPDALENVLRAVRSSLTGGQRLVLLFGCGGDRDHEKRPMMGRAASRFADFTIVTSDNTRSENPSDIIAAILKGIDKERPYIVIENRREAIKYAMTTARPGDVILLCGKGHERYEITADGRHDFDEREVIRSCW
ncbi:MAG: UDP-N-acetylmuramoyl-L-alanyl-D-glutamate--2,6-diaminopimelate ligase [Eubacteriales bacterium]